MCAWARRCSASGDEPERAAQGIIFDFDGVIADSEIVSALSFSRALTEAGLPTTIDDATALYTGLIREDVLRAMAAHWGDRTPPDLAERVAAQADAAIAAGFDPVPGAADFIASVAHLPLAIGSSSTTAYIRRHLDSFRLAEPFGIHVYSGASMWRAASRIPTSISMPPRRWASIRARRSSSRIRRSGRGQQSPRARASSASPAAAMRGGPGRGAGQGRCRDRAAELWRDRAASGFSSHGLRPFSAGSCGKALDVWALDVWRKTPKFRSDTPGSGSALPERMRTSCASPR